MKDIIVGMSGGVDSSVAAFLLKRQGYSVKALFMNNWEGEGEECPSERDFEDVKLVCAHLDIPYWTVNFSAQYLDLVFSYFLSEYKKGRTPNPDVLCNREIKFGVFLDFAHKLGVNTVATGHYCNTMNTNDGVLLLKAKDKNKDQSYFLHQLNQNQLSCANFPLGNLVKSEVRELAQKNGLINYNKKDSTGICFIGERKFKEFLSTYLAAQKGIVRTEEGEIVGTHDGLMYYTLGQRRGLGIGGNSQFEQGRWFVLRKDLDKNELIVCQNQQALLSKALIGINAHWILGSPPAKEFRANAKFRYRQPDQGVLVQIDGNNMVQVTFDQPQRAITEGQYAVFYQDDVCLGGVEIDKVIK